VPDKKAISCRYVQLATANMSLENMRPNGRSVHHGFCLRKTNT
jgi:hypothetical protein